MKLIHLVAMALLSTLGSATAKESNGSALHALESSSTVVNRGGSRAGAQKYSPLVNSMAACSGPACVATMAPATGAATTTSAGTSKAPPYDGTNGTAMNFTGLAGDATSGPALKPSPQPATGSTLSGLGAGQPSVVIVGVSLEGARVDR